MTSTAEGAAPPAGQAACDPELGLLHEAYCLPALLTRKFTHAELWGVLGAVVDEGRGLAREEIGRSAEGRPIYAVSFGRGPRRVLLWSQMHGDEPSHTMALADLFCYFAREPDDERVRRLDEGLTLVAVPMLNPDGAERFRRPNAQGIDLNRDARAWATPELRALRDLHARFRPELAFNLHDQDVRKRVGESDRLTAVALFACATAAEGPDEARVRAKRICGVIRQAVEPLVGGHVARFAHTYDPQAMGEWMQRAGTSTVLLESGFWPDDPEKQFLRKVSFVALLAALESVADGSWADVPVDRYDELPENDADVFDLVVRGGTVVVPGLAPFRADVGVSFPEPLEPGGGTVAAVGDLSASAARKVLDAADLFVHPELEALCGNGHGPLVLEEGLPASFTLRRGPEVESEEVAAVRRGIVREPGAEGELRVDEETPVDGDAPAGRGTAAGGGMTANGIAPGPDVAAGDGGEGGGG